MRKETGRPRSDGIQLKRRQGPLPGFHRYDDAGGRSRFGADVLRKPRDARGRAAGRADVAPRSQKRVIAIIVVVLVIIVAGFAVIPIEPRAQARRDGFAEPPALRRVVGPVLGEPFHALEPRDLREDRPPRAPPDVPRDRILVVRVFVTATDEIADALAEKPRRDIRDIRVSSAPISARDDVATGGVRTDYRRVARDGRGARVRISPASATPSASSSSSSTTNESSPRSISLQSGS